MNDQNNKSELTFYAVTTEAREGPTGLSWEGVLVKTLARLSSHDSWVPPRCSVQRRPASSQIPHVWFGADLAQMKQMLPKLDIGVCGVILPNEMIVPH